MKKRPTIRIITFLSAALVVAGIFAIRGTRKANALDRYARASTERAFDELVTSVSEMSNALEKSVYTTDPALAGALCTQIFGRAMTAQTALEALPYASQEMEQTASFVAKAGDYASALSRTVGDGGWSGEEMANLKSLADTASVMKLNLQDMQSRLAQGEMALDQVYARASSELGGEDQPPLVGETFQTIEQEFPELPTLIYDGPFSETMARRQALYLEGKKEVEEEEALKKAAKFLDIAAAELRSAGECGGDVPCWIFACHMLGGEYSVYVTKQGGEIWSVVGARSVGVPIYTVDQGLALAGDYIKGWGLKSLEESYHTVSDGVLLVNYEYAEKGVRCYPDLIKVGVALDTGALMSYDAQGYITAHTKRSIPEAAVSEQEAQESLSQALAVQAHAMAIIPTEGGQERYCHEFLCQSEDGDKYLMYVNAQTGAEEKILILLEDETGALTI